MKKIFIFVVILLFPCFVYAEDLIPNAKSGILIEASSGKILFSKDVDKRLSVASMTKMVAQIIILEDIESKKINWDDIVTVSKNASDMGGSQIYIEEGEKISVRDLMKGISVSSGNDAVVAMAEYISGSEKAFVKRMNKVVERLKLKNTHFVNCTGLDEKNHFSSSYDMAIIARELVVNHPQILSFSSIYEDYLRKDTDNKFWLVNTNKLIKQYDGADGLKTGHTDDALYCLAATAKRNNVRLIAVVLGENNSNVRNEETKQLLDYGFRNIKLKKINSKNEVVKKINVPIATSETLDVKLNDDIYVVENNDKSLKYTYKVLVDKIVLPIKKEDVVGEIQVYEGDKLIISKELVAGNSIKKQSFYDYFISNSCRFFSGNI